MERNITFQTSKIGCTIVIGFTYSTFLVSMRVDRNMEIFDYLYFFFDLNIRDLTYKI